MNENSTISSAPAEDNSTEIPHTVTNITSNLTKSESAETKPATSPNENKENAPKIVLKRLSSSVSSSSFALPKVNCTEKIIFCVDHSAEMFMNRFKRTVQSIKQSSVFHVLSGAIRQFIFSKSAINSKHEYSLILLDQDAKLMSNPNVFGQELLTMLNEIGVNTSNVDQQTFDIASLYDLISTYLPQSTTLKTPPYVVRVIFIYGRSNCGIDFLSGKKSFEKACGNPLFFFDSIYIHEEPLKNNKVSETFTSICNLDINGTSYIYEVSIDGSMSALYNALAKLLAHPLQRCSQSNSTNHDIM